MSSNDVFAQIEAATMQPKYLAKSAWIEHIPFSFVLMSILRPRLFVELGTHLGTSYFAFCQAAVAQDLETKIKTFAVDTWLGDDHSGTYGEEVFSEVQSHNSRNYPDFSTLLRCEFDDAVAKFEDKSIDLLHIDGYHTYEAVSHDFSTWLPKMSDRGVVILHDTNVKTGDFGVHKLYEDLKSKYPSFEFLHGYGLGIIGVGAEQPSDLVKLYNSNNSKRATQVQNTFSRLGKLVNQLKAQAN